jgi:hypothetical protein
LRTIASLLLLLLLLVMGACVASCGTDPDETRTGPDTANVILLLVLLLLLASPVIIYGVRGQLRSRSLDRQYKQYRSEWYADIRNNVRPYNGGPRWQSRPSPTTPIAAQVTAQPWIAQPSPHQWAPVGQQSAFWRQAGVERGPWPSKREPTPTNPVNPAPSGQEPMFDATLMALNKSWQNLVKLAPRPPARLSKVEKAKYIDNWIATNSGMPIETIFETRQACNTAIHHWDEIDSAAVDKAMEVIRHVTATLHNRQN